MLSLCRVQIVFGVISPKSKRRTVTTAVAIATPVSCESQLAAANCVVRSVAYAAVAVLIILFPIRMVISSLSVFSLIFSSDSAPKRFSRTRLETACFEVVIRAISEPEKKAEKKIRIMNISIETGSKCKILEIKRK